MSNKFVLSLWILVTLIFVVDSWMTSRLNNYLIFENTFRNLIHQRSFYDAYPQFHDDVNHYGPVFSVLMMPFAILPNWLGLLMWNLFNCIFLYKAIQTLPMKEEHKLMIGYIAIPCLIESMLNQQFNAGAGALMILSFTLLYKNRGFWSAFCLVFGTFVKLYGVVGIVFIFFSKNKKQYIIWCLVWAIILFVAPMIFASPSFVAHSYLDWKASLIEKNLSNIFGESTDISIMGFLRRLFHTQDISNFFFLIFGSVLFMLPFINPSQFSKKRFQLFVLSSALLFPVLFSTGSEDCTYIIAIPAVGIWFCLEPNLKLKQVLLPILLLITCDFPRLFFLPLAKLYPITLTMLSLPYFLVWLRVLYFSLRKKHLFVEEAEQEWIAA
ncbi:glycosyltransferase family 87 protein [Pedobacter sp. AW1-32]|uniref:glycosyltransferase family 87 protein n=1 Tax=Pedobacter sp. AW1-32 TaxID=3383026 RepID=UPI003FED59AC